jgi:hypothetical protein
MESIVTFTLPEVNYKCSLNLRGRKRYGTLKQLLDTGMCMPSTVGMPDGSNNELPDFRKSYKYISTIDFDLDPELVKIHLKKLVPENDEVSWKKTQKYDIIQYLSGGFFKEHTDKQIKKTHYGTLLIFPPAIDTLKHTGGELIIDKGRFIFNSSTNTEWTFIAFHTNLPHECKEVLTGTRIVFKTELYSIKTILREYYTHQICDRSISRAHTYED